MRELSVLDRARRLILAATGEEYGDGYTVTDLCVGYAEPGYGSNESVIVFGDWNPTGPNRWDNPTKSENLGPRLARALETAGCEIEWSDEWTQCGDCYRAMRTQPDSYSWTLYGAFCEDGYVCADCLRKDPESLVTDYVNDASRALTFLSGSDLEPLGFKQWAPGDPQTYESGWHPGQDDKPETILASILEDDANAEVVFLIDGVGQFDMRFSAWARTPQDNNQEEETS